MPEKRHDTDVFVPEVHDQLRRKRRMLELTHSSTRATMIMLGAALLALVIANIPQLMSFHEVWEAVYLGFTIGDFAAKITLGHFINDFFMAIFFLMVGLEIKFELAAGDLRKPRKALLPILGAAGGAVVPALVYFAFNSVNGTIEGWGVPMANDIAFCLGILALLGSRVPLGLRTFLSTLTIADDIIAILVIAIFYTADLHIGWLIGGLACFALLILINKRHVYDLSWYLVIGLVMWVCFLLSGVHATIAGVLLALTIPARTQVKLEKVNTWFAHKAQTAEDRYDPGEPAVKQKEYLAEVKQIGKVSRFSIPPITRLDHSLHGIVYFFILPLFAFSNAGVTLLDIDLTSMVTSSVFLGVFFGLLIGKPLGIFLATFLTVKFKICDLPEGVRWGHMAAVSVLGGVGFTMAIFIANLAFADPVLTDFAKMAIIAASLIAGVAGFLLLRHQANKDTAASKEGSEGSADASASDDEDDPLDVQSAAAEAANIANSLVQLAPHDDEEPDE